jgi:predicted Mrr-cat superfamily restriction endonuclease
LNGIAIGSWTSNLWNFAHEIQTGDGIIAYDPEKREYRADTAIGPYRHDPSVIDPEYPNVIPVL